MGGGGEYYDRNTTDKSLRTTRGFSTVAEKALSRDRVDPALSPRNRRITCKNKSPVVFAFDVTGSMGSLPKIIYDKMPMIAGQVVEQKYLDDPAVSVAAIGDILSDAAPIQIGDFSLVRNLDEWLGRIWLEGNGGGQGKESYELTLFFYARNCDMPNAETPFLIITGDEGFRETLVAADLKDRLGGNHESTNSQTIFNELKEKFKGNVFLIHRRYTSGAGEDSEIVRQWEKALGKDNVIKLGSDLAIGDTIVGVFAIVTGSRTLDEYLQDMRTRKNPITGEIEPQTEERIAEVRKSLEPLATNLKVVPKKKIRKSEAQTETEKEKESKKTEETTSGKKKRARIF